MTQLLHPERWPELAPEFDAYEHIQMARDTLATANPRAAQALDLAARSLHPRVLDPIAQAEYRELSGKAREEQRERDGGMVGGPDGDDDDVIGAR